MTSQPYISICIPAYNRVEKLGRLLDSIVWQNYKNFEVIIADDSNTSQVVELIQAYPTLPIIYYHNKTALGTPENWNEAVRQASGKWIKIMHDDDWFATNTALSKFAAIAQKNTGTFIFSAYNNVIAQKQVIAVQPSPLRLKRVIRFPANLWAQNIIGPPSVVMYPNDGQFIYDNQMKWLVDIDMYIRRMAVHKPVFIPELLINVELGETQVTAAVKNDPRVEVPEHFMLLQKTGLSALKHILVYDYHWRFIRNFKVKAFDYFYQYGYTGNLIPVYVSMIKWQQRLPAVFIKTGIFSKFFMLLHFMLHKNKLK